MEFIKSTESRSILKCGLNTTLKFDFSKNSMRSIPQISRRLFLPYEGVIKINFGFSSVFLNISFSFSSVSSLPYPYFTNFFSFNL